jgi:PAS domain S-box-containing protein
MSKKQQTFDPVELLNGNDPESGMHLSQQKVVIQIAKQALLSSNLNQLSKETLELAKAILNIDLGEVMRVDNIQRRLIIIASVGWPTADYDVISRDYKPGFMTDFVLQQSLPVYSPDLRNEKRFNVPGQLLDQNVVSMVSAAIQGKEKPFGIISVFSTRPRVFSNIEINFIQKVANLLALAVDRRRLESSLLTSRDEMAVILEGIAEGITVQAGDGTLKYANDTAAKLLGFSNRDELLETPISKLLAGIQFFNEDGNIIPIDQFPGRRVLKGEPEVTGVIRMRYLATGQERWLMATSSTVLDSLNQERLAVNIFQDITGIKENERDQNFLAELSSILALAVTYEDVLKNIADMAINYLSDWCVVHMTEGNGEVRQLAVSHKDPQKIALVLDLQEKYPPRTDAASGIFQVMRTGRGEFFPIIPNEAIKAIAQDEEHFQMLSSLGLNSAMILPLIARGHTQGTITLVWAESNHTYNDREKQIGLDLAQRAALAIDNVRLYQEARILNEQLEIKVLRRTAQLEQMNTKLQSEINERIHAEHEIQRSKALFSDLFELSPDAIFLINQEGKIIRVNNQGAFIFGYEQDDLINKSIDILLPEQFRKVHIMHRMNYQNNSGRRSISPGYELHGRRKSGEQFPVDVMLSPVKIGDDWLVISVVRDISEQKRTQAELAEMQHRLFDSQEAERLVLAQELHDGTIQELFSINFQLAEISSDAINEGLPELGKKILSAGEMTQNVIQGLRNISRDLRPPALAPFGLEQALYSHLERFQELHPELEIHTELEADGQMLEKNLRLVLFRIFQNAVSNVARHAQAQQLWVRLEFDEQQITLEIEDDGKGFDVPERWVEFVRNGHLGLVGIRERVEAINGNLTIVSRPGDGTLIKVNVPLNHG